VALGAFGVDDSRALSAAVVLHAVNFVPFIVAGLALLRFHVVATARAVEESRAAAEK
jgi:hypothetical protein